MYASHAAAPPVTSPSSSDEQFHVLFGPGDVRRVLLSQLDELFSRGVVNANTFVWAEGMTAWQTLGEAAGLDDDIEDADLLDDEDAEDTVVFTSRSVPMLPPPANAPRGPALRVAAPPPMRSAPPPARSAPPPARSAPPLGSAPPPPRVSSPAPARTRSAIVPIAQARSAPTAPAVQRPSTPHPSHLRVVPAHVETAAPSLAPLASDGLEANPFERDRGHWRRKVQFTLLFVAMVAGTVVTLYRNDLTLAWAKSLHQSSTYLDLERRWFGGAPAGTPRELDALLGRATAATDDGATDATSLLSATMLNHPAATEPARHPAATDPAANPAGGTEEPASAHKTRDTSATPPDEKPSAALPAEATSAPQATPRLDDSSAKSVEDLPRVSSSKHTATSSARKSRVATTHTRSHHERSTPHKEEHAPAKAAKSDEPAPAPGTDAFLRASIRDAVKNQKSKKKHHRSKKGKSSFDPLNGDL
jgi:hypothetical protein